jgi:hypothetical protein
MDTGTKLTFFAIIMYGTAIAVSSVAFTPLGGLVVAVMIVVTIKSVG